MYFGLDDINEMTTSMKRIYVLDSVKRMWVMDNGWLIWMFWSLMRQWIFLWNIMTHNCDHQKGGDCWISDFDDEKL